MTNEEAVQSIEAIRQKFLRQYGEETMVAVLIDGDDVRAFDAAISALKERPKGEWIPIEVRPLTEEEKEYYAEHEYPVDFMMMYDCQMPDDGQEVLITTSAGYVTTDTYYIDEGGYFENYCDEGDVKAWMPKPEPYKKGGE